MSFLSTWICTQWRFMYQGSDIFQTRKSRNPTNKNQHWRWAHVHRYLRTNWWLSKGDVRIDEQVLQGKVCKEFEFMHHKQREVYWDNQWSDIHNLLPINDENLWSCWVHWLKKGFKTYEKNNRALIQPKDFNSSLFTGGNQFWSEQKIWKYPQRLYPFDHSETRW